MATTAAEICNVALGRIGERQPISSLEESSTNARSCKTFYAANRNTVLASYPWQFATGRSALTATTLTRTNWQYAYSLPPDCLFARYLALPGAREPRPDQRIPFGLEHDTVLKKVLVTNQADAELVYTRLVDDVTLFEPMFVEALAWKMAADLTMGIALKPQVALSIINGYAAALATAQALDARQSQAGPEPEGSYIRARGGSGHHRHGR